MVTVMDIGIMRMFVCQPPVLMAVSVGFAGRIKQRVLVLVMLVMIVEMFVFLRLMNMWVFVSLGDVQPDAY